MPGRQATRTLEQGDDSVNNKDIVLVALFDAGGGDRIVTTEHVAAKVFEYPIGRQRYRWEHFAQYPDKERVARELRRMKKGAGPRGGAGFVEGHVNVGAKLDRSDGWRLTASGVQHAKAVAPRLRQSLSDEVGTGFVYDQEKIRRQIRQSKAFEQYEIASNAEGISEIQFTDLLYLLPDAPKQKIQSGFDQLQSAASASGAEDVLRFLKVLEERFGYLLGDR